MNNNKDKKKGLTFASDLIVATSYVYRLETLTIPVDDV